MISNKPNLIALSKSGQKRDNAPIHDHPIFFERADEKIGLFRRVGKVDDIPGVSVFVHHLPCPFLIHQFRRNPTPKLLDAQRKCMALSDK